MFVTARLPNEVGFERLQTISPDRDVTVQENGFVYESLYLDFGHGNEKRG